MILWRNIFKILRKNFERKLKKKFLILEGIIKVIPEKLLEESVKDFLEEFLEELLHVSLDYFRRNP